MLTVALQPENRLARRLLTLLIVLLGMAACDALAQGVRPLRLVVPFGPGAPDTIARLLAQQMNAQTGQSVVVDNRLGANGIIGSDLVAKAAPDGNTLLVVSASLVVNPAIYRSLPFDPLRDFAPITNLCAQQAFVLTLNPPGPALNAREFIALAKRPESEFAYGSPGIGNTIHLAGALFNSVAALHMTHVPYKGGGPATAALLSGEVQVMMSNELLVLPYHRSGRLRPIGVTGERRLASLPDVPTLAEQGVAGMDIDAGWFGLFAPVGTPRDTIEKLHAEVIKALGDPVVKGRLREQGFEVFGNRPEAFRSYLDAQLKLYANMVRVAGVIPE